MTVTMKEIDALRKAVADLQMRIHSCRSEYPFRRDCPGCIGLGAEIDVVNEKITHALRQWWAQGCREVEPSVEKDPRRRLFFIPEPAKPLIESPADKLAKRVRGEVLAMLGDTDTERRLRAALADYASTKNGDPTTRQQFGSPPDPVLVARMLIDSLTGGALSSLICTIRDADVRIPGEPMDRALVMRHYELDNLRANLKALGEIDRG